MAAETQYTANTGCVNMTTANTTMDASGGAGVYDVLTASSAAGMVGCIIKTITLKAQVSTTAGMIRLFIYNGTNVRLVQEIEVPAVTKSSVDPSFELHLNVNYYLKAGYVLRATTQNAESMNVIAEGTDVKYYTSVRAESTQYTANTGVGQVVTANTSLTGSGTLYDVVVASGAGTNGTNIMAVNIKSIVDTTAGMIRLFIYNGTTNFLYSEIPVAAVTKSSVAHSFSAREIFNGNNFAMQGGYTLRASTEIANTMNVIGEAANWAYPA